MSSWAHVGLLRIAPKSRDARRGVDKADAPGVQEPRFPSTVPTAAAAATQQK